MNNPRICRLALFALLGIGVALILVGVVADGLASSQAQHWMAAEDYADPSIRASGVHLLARVDRAIQLALFICGGLVTIFSAIGIWAYEVIGLRALAPVNRSSYARSLRVVAFMLMFAGLIASTWGGSVEVNSFREGPNQGGGWPPIEGRSSERQHAFALKNAGVALVCAGPVVWLFGTMLMKARARRFDRNAEPPLR